MKNIIEIITDNKVGYKFQCDDRRSPKGVEVDDYFLLSEVDKFNQVLNLCNKYHLNYTLVLEEWSEEESQITNEIFIVDNNHKNG